MQDPNTGRFGRLYTAPDGYSGCPRCNWKRTDGLVWGDETNLAEYCSPACAEKSEALATGLSVNAVRRHHKPANAKG